MSEKNKEWMENVISNEISGYKNQIKKLEEEIKECEAKIEKLNLKSICSHEVSVHHYKDYYSKITTYFCIKCGYQVEC
jgi:predicted  nucleic acid-binding Zn-ribbon protein